MNATADYTYHVQHSTTYDNKTVDCIIIEDLNQGNKSLTNDIENVVKDICFKEKLQLSKCLVIYKDSEGCWDGWNTRSFQFYSLNEKNPILALHKALRRYN